MEFKKLKIAIISHIVPPLQSGQAIVLYHLLNGLPANRYCIITREYEHDTNKISTNKLPAHYYEIKNCIDTRKNLLFQITIPLKLVYSMFIKVLKIISIKNLEQINLFVACTGDFLDLPATYIAAKITKTKYVLYIFDDYIFQWTGILRKIIGFIAPKILKEAVQIIVPNNFLQKEYFKRYSVKSKIIYNPCILPNDMSSYKWNTNIKKGELSIIYTGSIYHAHYDAFVNLLKAIDLIEYKNIKLHIYTSQNEEELRCHGIYGEAVKYHDYISQDLVYNILKMADILFLPLAFESKIPEVINTSAPGKMGEYLAIGRPILVHAPKNSFISWYFKQNNCGIVVDKLDPYILASKIEELICDEKLQNDIINNAVKMANKDFDVNKQAYEFSLVLKEIEDSL